MFRLSMAFLIVVCSTLMGNWFSARLCNRRKTLLILVEAITRIKSNIMFLGSEIHSVINESFRGYKEFDTLCVEDINMDFLDWWKETIQNISSDTGLNNEDKRLLQRFGESLGVTDTEGQISNCNFYIEVFSQRYKNAIETEEKNSRLYKILGFTAGCTVTLVML